MMIEYTIAQADKDKLAAANPATLELMRLLYHHADGIVNLLCTEHEEPLKLCVPVFDFAWCLLHLVEKLQTENLAIFGFRESAATITFHRSEEVILITTDFSEWQCRCSHKHSRRAVIDFAQAVVDDLCGSIPELQDNPTVKEAYRKLAANSV